MPVGCVVGAPTSERCANDYAGTAIIVLAAALVGLGVAHRPAVLAHENAFQAQSDAVRAEQRRIDIARADSLRLDENYFRTCVAGVDPSHALCLFVDTSQSPRSQIDTNPIPNARYFGPRGLGRAG